MDKVKCFICGTDVEIPDDPPTTVRPPWYRDSITCSDCRKRYPPSLIKSCKDNFHYIIRIRGFSQVVNFTRARINGNWVTIFDEDEQDGVIINGEPYLRGYDVLLTEIIGCSDAPDIPFRTIVRT